MLKHHLIYSPCVHSHSSSQCYKGRQEEILKLKNFNSWRTSDLKLNFILKFEHLRILTSVSNLICFVYQILCIKIKK